MRIFKSKKIAIIITVLAMLFFSVEVSTESIIKISPKIKIIINILLIITVAIVNILSCNKSIDQVSPSLIKNIRVISIVVGVICFLGVFILKISGVI